MRLIHYTNEEFSLEPRIYDQSTCLWQSKPFGLWVSVEGEYDWKWWCEREGYRLEHLIVHYEVELKAEANILHLKTDNEILNFTKQYFYIKPQWDDPEGRKICGTYELNWTKVKENYQGIIISPYQWNCRLTEKASWYYGWDCASGCIWDLDCIKEFKLLN